MSSSRGLVAFCGGAALLMIDPPEGSARLEVSAATWLFSESSWLWSELSCSSAEARWEELLGSLAASTISFADARSSELIWDSRAEIWFLASAVVLVLL